MKAELKITVKPRYRLTFIRKGMKSKETRVYPPGKTPMEILIEAAKNGHKPTNMTPAPDCPAVIILQVTA